MLGIAVKLVGQTVIGLGVGTVIGNAVVATTPAVTSTVEKVLVLVGTSAIAVTVGNAVDNEFEKLWDKLDEAKAYRKAVKKSKSNNFVKEA